MRWKSVAWAGCLLPVLAGCGSLRNLANDVCLAHTQHGIEHDLRKCAHSAWHTVRSQHPRQAFTDEFHDGFLDGYVDYLDRGGAAQPPAVPPLKYVRNKKYFTPEGHCLVRDYYLGFKYGTDVAVASGRREFLTVPVLLPDASCAVETPAWPGPPVIPMKQPGTSDTKPKPPGSDTLPSPRPIPNSGKKPVDPIPVPPTARGPLPPRPDPGDERPISPLPKPDLPVILPYNPDPTGGKFSPAPVRPDPDLLPIPNPPLPIPNRPLPSPQIEPLPVPVEESKSTIPPNLGPLPTPIPVFKVTLPAPPGSVPTLQPSVPTPPVLDDIPAMPFQHTTPAPIPVGGLFPRK